MVEQVGNGFAFRNITIVEQLLQVAVFSLSGYEYFQRMLDHAHVHLLSETNCTNLREIQNNEST